MHKPVPQATYLKPTSTIARAACCALRQLSMRLDSDLKLWPHTSGPDSHALLRRQLSLFLHRQRHYMLLDCLILIPSSPRRAWDRSSLGPPAIHEWRPQQQPSPGTLSFGAGCQGIHSASSPCGCAAALSITSPQQHGPWAEHPGVSSYLPTPHSSSGLGP
jgi:hypothetical protein